MNFCLSDLVPPLRWSDAARIEGLHGRGPLPDAWWRSLPMDRVMAIFDPESLGDLLTDLALDQWPAASIGDVLPALHILDPDDADDPQVAIALDRVGSWSGLLALTSRELSDQPFIKARPVLAALFTAAFVRLAPDEAAIPAPVRSVEPAAEEAAPVKQEARAQSRPEAQQNVPSSAKPTMLAPLVKPADVSPAPPVNPAPAVASSPAVIPTPRASSESAPADIPALLDAAFADLDDRMWMVAQNRVFTDVPSAPEELAKLLSCTPEVIETLETALRDRLREWLAGAPAAPFNAHVARVAEALGVAAPKSRLIAAAPWHEQELRSLDVPAWQFVLACLTGYQVSGDWLVAGDLADLHEKTRGLIVNSERPPTVSRALELVSSLGIHPEVAKEWLENVPQLRIQSGGANGVRPAAAVKEEPVRGPLKDVALTRRCFRQPDGRWWLRVDVTADHLAGAEIALPSGFASYIGLSPGDSRTVRSAAGDVVLSWQAHPVLGSLRQILTEVAAKENSHVFLTLSDEGMLRVRHLPAGVGGEPISRALRLVGYTAPSGTREQAVRVISTRIGLTGPVGPPELLTRLRERGDRDLLALLA
ncbi:hypothetical protein J5X84_32590 [Streptosporangiaceae bacterium NEAU-GS5]|nr:hypothetical protein [Streptosporangiaceae bacterium NEAU-GS5]